MSPRIRVLVVDDAVVVRKMVSEALAADPALEVAGVAANGRIALAKLPYVSPDVVVLDLDMPELDGAATLAALRRVLPRLPVVVFSALPDLAAGALAGGADDVVLKPVASPDGGGMARALAELAAKVRQCGRRARGGALFSRPPLPPPAAASVVLAPHPAPGAAGPYGPEVEVVAVGVSTGGPNALAAVFAGLPEDFPVPLVVVQHMPPMFTGLLAQRLSAGSRIAVREGVAGHALRAGEAWIAPGDYHMVVAREGPEVALRLHQGAPENSCRPAVDVLFRSVAEAYGPRALAVVLTGMGQDGLRGCGALRAAGAQVVVQDEATSVVWGMPGYVARAGLAHAVLPLGDVASEIVRRVGARGERARRLLANVG